MLDREMLYEALHKEIPILTTQIRKLYAELDQKFHLEGAKVPMTFEWTEVALALIHRQEAENGNIFIFPCCLWDIPWNIH